jgi:hypothetical protein
MVNASNYLVRAAGARDGDHQDSSGECQRASCVTLWKSRFCYNGIYWHIREKRLFFIAAIAATSGVTAGAPRHAWCISMLSPQAQAG